MTICGWEWIFKKEKEGTEDTKAIKKYVKNLQNRKQTKWTLNWTKIRDGYKLSYEKETMSTLTIFKKI